MIRIGEAYYPGEEDVPMFGLGQNGSLYDPKVVEVAFRHEPAVEVNDLFGLGGMGATVTDLDKIKFKLTPSDILGLVGTSATVWFVLRELPKEKNKFFKGLGFFIMIAGVTGVALSLRHVLQNPKTVGTLVRENKAEIVNPEKS